MKTSEIPLDRDLTEEERLEIIRQPPEPCIFKKGDPIRDIRSHRVRILEQDELETRKNWFGIVKATDDDIYYYNKIMYEELIELEQEVEKKLRRINNLKEDILNH